MKWEYTQPVQILFGGGRAEEIGSYAAGRGWENGLLVCARHLQANGGAQKLIEKSGGRLTGVFSDIEPNPTVENVMDCAAELKRMQCGFVAAVGGGSVLDCAKAAASICLTDDNITRYHGTGVPLPPAHLPVIAVPTTAGTGSEVTCVSVLSNHRTGFKGPIHAESLYPELAIVDPELTVSMPPSVTAATGIDVLSHAIEGYWSKGHQPVCDALAVHAARLVFTWLPQAYADGTDRQAREKMCEASVIAGLAFTLPKTTSSHACSFPLTNLLGIPHGEACGLTLDWFARINRTDSRTQQLAGLLGFAGADTMAAAIAQLKIQLHLRTDLQSFCLSDAQVKQLVQASHHPNLLNNPVPITDAMLTEMYNTFR